MEQCDAIQRVFEDLSKKGLSGKPLLVSQLAPEVKNPDSACGPCCVVNLTQFALKYFGEEIIPAPNEVANAIHESDGGHNITQTSSMLRGTLGSHFASNRIVISTRVLDIGHEDTRGGDNSFSGETLVCSKPAEGCFGADIASLVLTHEGEFSGGHTLLFLGYEKSSGHMMVLDPVNTKRIVKFEVQEKVVNINDRNVSTLRLKFLGPMEHFFSAEYVMMDGIYVLGLTSVIVLSC